MGNSHKGRFFFLLTIQKYNSTIVNCMYISLGNRDNCNKCISASSTHFHLRVTQTVIGFFFYCIGNENVGTRLACFQLQVNVNLFKMATRILRTIGAWKKWKKIKWIIGELYNLLQVFRSPPCWIVTHFHKAGMSAFTLILQSQMPLW